MNDLAALLEHAAERSKGLQSCYERLLEQQARLGRLHNPPPDSVQWFETFTRGFVITTTPLDVAVPFKKCMEELPCSWVMTSATLAVGQSFEHFNQRMGLDKAHDACNSTARLITGITRCCICPPGCQNRKMRVLYPPWWKRRFR